MKHRLFLNAASLSLLTVLLAGSVGVAPATQPARPMPPMFGERPPTLERVMKQMGHTLQAIDGQLDDAANDADTLPLVNQAQVLTVTAKNLYPDDVGEATGEAKINAISDYRARMIALIRAELELEEALLRTDHPAARTAFAKIVQQQKNGHEAYGVGDDDHQKR